MHDGECQQVHDGECQQVHDRESVSKCMIGRVSASA